MATAYGTFDGYRGCLALNFADLQAGALERCGGIPVVAAGFLGQSGQFVGACTASAGASAMGVVVPKADFSQPERFKFYASHKPLP